MIVNKYFLNGIQMYPIKKEQTADIYYGYANGGSSVNLQEDKKILIYLFENINTGKLSLNFVINKTVTGTIGTANITVSGLPVSNILLLSDDSGEVVKINDTTINGNFSWSTNTDGMIIDNIQEFNEITINLNTFTTIDKWKINTSGGDCSYISVDTNILKLTKIQENYSGNLYLEPTPGVYKTDQTINIKKNTTVKNVIYTTDGKAPTLAKYIAYDNLSPSNPFIAVVQDGKGNVVFDGGFPKFYNNQWGNWTTYSSLSDTFKYFANVLNFIANPAKVSAGNKKILFLGDGTASYLINGTGEADFKKSINGICSVLGFIPTIMQSNNFANNIIDYLILH